MDYDPRELYKIQADRSRDGNELATFTNANGKDAKYCYLVNASSVIGVL